MMESEIEAVNILFVVRNILFKSLSLQEEEKK